MEDQGFRLNLLRIGLVVIVVIYSIQLFSIQILSGEFHLTRAQDISRRTFIIPATRGEIFDRSFTEPLVMNRDAFAVSIIPAEVPRGSMENVLTFLSEILEIPVEDITSRLPRQHLQRYQPMEIASNLSFDTVAKLAERRHMLPGVSWYIKPVRYYRDAGSLSHVLGFVGEITRDELTVLFNYGYQPGDIIGKAGIERQHDLLLRGSDGREIRTVDARGRRVANRENVRIPPDDGKDIVLTIDRNLQTLVERALGSRVGSIVVLRPSTGEVLAMVSYPWFDPNIFTTGLQSEFRALVDAPNNPFLNRAIQASYPPASAWKTVLNVAIHAEGVFPPEQTILCQGFIHFGNRDWGCHVRRGHGRLNLRQAHAQSCNIYYMIVAREHLGIERLVYHSRGLGFGSLTGIDLPGEIPGFIPTPYWKERRFHESWFAGDTMNFSIGQGFTLVTPLQMANKVAMIVNDGVVYRPHLLKEVRNPVTGAVESVTSPVVLHRSDIPPEVWREVRADMRATVTEGTPAVLLNMRSVQIAGKTGTAEVGFTDRFHSWFTAFGPYDNPHAENAIAMAVIVEAVNDWEWWAPWASGVIFQGHFMNQTFEEAVRALGWQWRIPLEHRE